MGVSNTTTLCSMKYRKQKCFFDICKFPIGTDSFKWNNLNITKLVQFKTRTSSLLFISYGNTLFWLKLFLNFSEKFFRKNWLRISFKLIKIYSRWLLKISYLYILVGFLFIIFHCHVTFSCRFSLNVGGKVALVTLLRSKRNGLYPIYKG